jgi:hypothetical protein
LELGWTDSALQQRIRDATRTGRPLGNSEFLDAAEQATGRSLRPARRGPNQSSVRRSCWGVLGFRSLSPKS